MLIHADKYNHEGHEVHEENVSITRGEIYLSGGSVFGYYVGMSEEAQNLGNAKADVESKIKPKNIFATGSFVLGLLGLLMFSLGILCSSNWFLNLLLSFERWSFNDLADILTHWSMIFYCTWHLLLLFALCFGILYIIRFYKLEKCLISIAELI
jgi:hypothetical protein